MPGCLPAVHRRSVPPIGCPPNPVRRPGSICPAVRCPARPVSGHLSPLAGRGCPAVRCPARLVSSPSGVCPSSVCPVAAVSSRVSRVVAMGDTSVQRGSGHDWIWIESSSMWSGPAQRLGRRPEQAWMRAPLRRSCAGRRGSVGRGPGRVVLRREAAPDRPGRPDRREGALSLATALGQGAG
jgi:hypothetical protein